MHIHCALLVLKETTLNVLQLKKIRKLGSSQQFKRSYNIIREYNKCWPVPTNESLEQAKKHMIPLDVNVK